MMIEQFRQCGYKTESVELTAETLVAAQYGTVWQDPIIEEDGAVNERRPDRATMAPLLSVGGAYKGTFKGSFEPRPFGTDATAPDWYALLNAAGATIATDVATFGAEYAGSTSVLGTPVTIKTRDGVYERTLAGARVSKLTFKAEAGSTWMCDAEATGRYTEAVQASFVAAAHPSAGVGQPFLGSAATFGGSTVAISSAEISIENTVSASKDAVHASGFGRNVITEQKLLLKMSVLEDGTINWKDKYRGDATGDALAVSLPMSTGSAGNVLTWTGNITLTKKPTISYVDGIGYAQVEGEFFTAGAAAALTLTQT